MTSSAEGLTFRIIGGPIPKDVKIAVRCNGSDIVAAALALADDSLRRELHLRGTGEKLWEHGPVIHPSSFDVLQLELIGGGQGKVIAMLDADDRISAFVKRGARAETVLLLRARSFLPPGIPQGSRSKVLKLAAPLIVKKKPEPKPPTPPPPKPDLALRIIGGPIPRDVRIVLKVFHTTQFMDMFPLIHEKVELVAPLSVVSARYYNLYEFEIVRHGKGKKRRALFAKDTPSSIELTSNVLLLEEKPIWKHMPKPAEMRGDDESSEADSDNLSDIRPPSATSTLRDRDTDTPPGTIGVAVDGGDLTEEPGWWEANGGTALTEDALKVKNANLAGSDDNIAMSKQILDLVMPSNQQAQLVRVVGKVIPRTARVIIDILRTQTFISLFPMIQAKVLEFIPTAHITPYRYELHELELLPHGKTRVVKTLKLEQTAWTSDFGLASILMLREIPQGFLQGASDEQSTLQYEEIVHMPAESSFVGPSKPGTATSYQSASTVAAARVRQEQIAGPHSSSTEMRDDSRRRVTTPAGETITPRPSQHGLVSGLASFGGSIAGDFDMESSKQPSLFQGSIDVNDMQLLDEDADEAADAYVRDASPAEEPPLHNSGEAEQSAATDDHIQHVDASATLSTPFTDPTPEVETTILGAAAVDELELVDDAEEAVPSTHRAQTPPSQTDAAAADSSPKLQFQFSSPHHQVNASGVVDIGEEDDDGAAHRQQPHPAEDDYSPSPNAPMRAPSVPLLVPLSKSSKHNVYSDRTPRALLDVLAVEPPPPPPPPVKDLGGSVKLSGSQRLLTPREAPPAILQEPHPHSTLQDLYDQPETTAPIRMPSAKAGGSKVASTVLAFNALRSMASLGRSVKESSTRWDSDEEN
ncbi:Hypothetical protein, putative [Bodo saltans]|uniref:Uncharacterized protein n=1 Tax=Bodo saltans TaxID=75058 RepID=A0A0S4J6I1_BODSA|nr:Hypothetical protein, putative [Bodo saltans]|eukprot:CUG85436.1 Hypothetical protein, putative [Bodo saltans]